MHTSDWLRHFNVSIFFSSFKPVAKPLKKFTRISREFKPVYNKVLKPVGDYARGVLNNTHNLIFGGKKNKRKIEIEPWTEAHKFCGEF